MCGWGGGEEECGGEREGGSGRVTVTVLLQCHFYPESYKLRVWLILLIKYKKYIIRNTKRTITNI